MNKHNYIYNKTRQVIQNEFNTLDSFLGYKMFNRIKNDERGLLFKNGNYIRVLKPGNHFFLPFMGYRVRKMNVNNNFYSEKNLNIYLTDNQLLNELLIADIKDHEIGLHYEDDHFCEVLLPGKYAFWTVIKKHQVIHIDTRIPEIGAEIDKSIFESNLLAGRFLIFEVSSFEKGLVFYNGVYLQTVLPGRYYFWKSPVSVLIQKVDMRQLQLDISGQEIMTEDKITLRINFVSHYRVTDPVKALLEIKSYQEQVYILLQLILREYVGTLSLDDLLSKKEEIGNFVLEKIKQKENIFGIEFIFAGLKDLILPGEMKNILNQVIEAEKRAQATIITRREETASTRSLLNTAKLMENNPILLKLKELEYVERICDKVDKLTLISGNSLLDQLGKTFIGKEIVS